MDTLFIRFILRIRTKSYKLKTFKYLKITKAKNLLNFLTILKIKPHFKNSSIQVIIIKSKNCQYFEQAKKSKILEKKNNLAPKFGKAKRLYSI